MDPPGVFEAQRRNGPEERNVALSAEVIWEPDLDLQGMRGGAETQRMDKSSRAQESKGRPARLRSAGALDAVRDAEFS